MSKISDVVIGFDVEWKPVFKKDQYNKTACVQLCWSSEECVVVHLVGMSSFPSELAVLLESQSILKVGVGVRGDMQRLVNEKRIRSIGAIVELAGMAGMKNAGLKQLLYHQTKYVVQKNKKLTMSNWEHAPLSKEQVEYATLDALSGWLIYQKLVLQTGKHQFNVWLS